MPPATATGPATRAWCWSTTRSTPWSRSRARTGSAGSSSSPRTASRRRARSWSTTSGRHGSARRSSRATDVSRLSGLPRCRRPSLSDRAREHGPVSRREAWITALAVFAIAIAVRVVAASIITFPKPEDTAYYVGVARNLVEGRGLVSDALWSYGTPPLVFPRPAFEVWLPLPSLLAAIPMALAGGPARSRSRRRCARARWSPSSPAPSSRSSPGASPPTSPWSAACRPGRARTLAAGAGLRRRCTCRCCSTPRCPTPRCCSAPWSSARRCS